MLISIVIPIYNREKTLSRLFQSLQKQEYRPLEIILVDNFSDDTSFKMCLDFQERFSNVSFHIEVTRNPKKGACSCRNQGWKMAHGDYIYFFDSDDEISSDFLVDAQHYFGADMICAPTVMYFDNGRKKVRDFFPTSSPSHQILTAMLSTQTFLVRNAFLNAVGGWDESLPRWNDWELGVRLLLHRPELIWIKGKAYHKIHQHQDSISGKSFSNDLSNLLVAIEAVNVSIDKFAYSQSEREHLRNALAAKLLLLSSQLYKEHSYAQSHEMKKKASTLIENPIRQKVFLFLSHVSDWGIAGMWHLYLPLL